MFNSFTLYIPAPLLPQLSPPFAVYPLKLAAGIRNIKNSYIYQTVMFYSSSRLFTPFGRVASLHDFFILSEKYIFVSFLQITTCTSCSKFSLNCQDSI